MDDNTRMIEGNHVSTDFSDRDSHLPSSCRNGTPIRSWSDDLSGFNYSNVLANTRSGGANDSSLIAASLAKDIVPNSASDGLRAKGGPLKTTARSEARLIKTPARDRAVLCARVARDFKGKEIIVLDMRKLSPLYDYFVIATGSSRRQIHAITEEIDAALNAVGDKRLSIEGYEASKWVVQDYGDIVVHVFDEETRDYYRLEDLWADAPRISIDE